MRGSQGPAFAAQIEVEFLLLELVVDVALVGSLLRSTGIVETPVGAQSAKEVLTAQGEVHGALAFQAGIAVVGCAAFGLDAHGSFVVDDTLVIL